MFMFKSYKIFQGKQYTHINLPIRKKKSFILVAVKTAILLSGWVAHTPALCPSYIHIHQLVRGMYVSSNLFIMQIQALVSPVANNTKIHLTCIKEYVSGWSVYASVSIALDASYVQFLRCFSCNEPFESSDNSNNARRPRRCAYLFIVYKTKSRRYNPLLS